MYCTFIYKSKRMFLVNLATGIYPANTLHNSNVTIKPKRPDVIFTSMLRIVFPGSTVGIGAYAIGKILWKHIVHRRGCSYSRWYIYVVDTSIVSFYIDAAFIHSICMMKLHHWKPRVAIIPTLSSLASSEVVVMTTSGATNDNRVGIIATLGFR